MVIRETECAGAYFAKNTQREKNGSPFAYKHANRGRQSEIFITHPSRYRGSLGSASQLVASFCPSRAKFIDGYHRSSVFLSIPVVCIELPCIESHSLSNSRFRALLILSLTPKFSRKLQVSFYRVNFIRRKLQEFWNPLSV